ncbi:MAG: hypothetical protein ACOCV8_05635, partial [Spirochaetota bacterium]
MDWDSLFRIAIIVAAIIGSGGGLLGLFFTYMNFENLDYKLIDKTQHWKITLSMIVKDMLISIIFTLTSIALIFINSWFLIFLFVLPLLIIAPETWKIEFSKKHRSNFKFRIREDSLFEKKLMTRRLNKLSDNLLNTQHYNKKINTDFISDKIANVIHSIFMYYLYILILYIIIDMLDNGLYITESESITTEVLLAGIIIS